MNHLKKFWYFNRIMKNQWLEPGKLRKMQNAKLIKIINHAHNNVEFYRRLFEKHAVGLSDIKKIDDLYRLPFTTKNDIQEENRQIMAKGFDISKLHKSRTSGSTGRPLNIYQDERSVMINDLIILRSRLENGMKIFDKMAYICDSRAFSIEKSFLEKFNILRKTSFSVHEDLDNCIAFLKNQKPDIIFSHPSYLLILARRLEEKGEEIKSKMIFSSGESLSPKQKNYISSVFQSELFDSYGVEEFGLVGWECKEHAGYHINSDNLIVEFVKDDEPVSNGERGEIVITGLNNYAMPFIRYKTGDVGIASQDLCNCGRTLDIMKNIKGRKDDFIILPSGRTISPRQINTLEFIEGIKEYRIIQKKKNLILVKIVKDENFSSKTTDGIGKELKRNCLDEDVKIKIKAVNKIPKDKTGKIRAVVSEVKK